MNMRLSPEELQWLRVCGTCYNLYETGRPDGQNQRCRCFIGPDIPWAGFDFNERARLCMCCAMEVLASGSKWSAYFCSECRQRVMDLSLREGRLVIPIGRHSLMHTWVPNTLAPSLAAHGGSAADLAQTVMTAASAVFGGTDRLWEWSPTIVARHLRHLGLPGSTPLIEYLGAIDGRGTGTTRLGLFAELSEFFGVRLDRPDEPGQA
jgi:hypothetical protein